MASRSDQDEDRKDHGLTAFAILLVLAVAVLLVAVTVSGMDKFG